MNERSNDRVSFAFAVKQAGAIAWSRAFPRLGRLWSAVGVAVGICSCFSGWISDFSFWCLVAVLACLVFSVGCFGYYFVRNFIDFFCKQGVIELYENGNRAFYLSIGGYEKTMQKILGSGKLLRKLEEKTVQTMAFAMGMDNTTCVKVSTTKGVLRPVMNLLKSKYNISAEDLQKWVNESLAGAKKEVPLAYGECLSVSPWVGKNELYNQKENVSLVLVANSSHKVSPEQINKENLNNLAYVEDARKTIIDLFQYVSKKHINCIVVGAMGTNEGNAPYAPVLDTIITAYEWCQSQGELSFPRVVVLSVRESDIKNHKLSLAYIVNRVRSTLKKLD